MLAGFENYSRFTLQKSGPSPPIPVYLPVLLHMTGSIIIKRTHTDHPDFQLLVSYLDHELWNELDEDQATYDPHNKVPGLSTAVMVYVSGQPAAIGCFKAYDTSTIEIKRMFVRKEFRGKGLSLKVLEELENWALENGYKKAVLETSIHFTIAKNLYKNSGYSVIPNYGPYHGLAESVCMGKELLPVTGN